MIKSIVFGANGYIGRHLVYYLSQQGQSIFSSPETIEAGTNLLPLLKHGTYTNLTNEVYKLRNETNPIKPEIELIKLSRKYTSKIKRQIKKEVEPLQPKIIISETFI